MKNIILIVATVSILGVASSVNSTSNSFISLEDLVGLNLPRFGPLGSTNKVCYFHNDAISIMPYTSPCDVALLDSFQRARLLSSENQQYARVLIEQGSSAHMEAAHVYPGDPECYTEKTVQFDEDITR